MRALLVTAAITVVVAWYPVSCIFWPLRDCRCCDGHGSHRPKGNRRISRPCRWCKRTGKRWRIGRRMWRWARRHHADAS